MSHSEPSSFNQKQFQLMLDRITSFDSRSIDFKDLISDLEGLITALDVSDASRNELLAKWGVLEEVYAYALDQDIERLEGPEVEVVKQALDELKEVVQRMQMSASGPSRDATPDG